MTLLLRPRSWQEKKKVLLTKCIHGSSGNHAYPA